MMSWQTAKIAGFVLQLLGYSYAIRNTAHPKRTTWPEQIARFRRAFEWLRRRFVRPRDHVATLAGTAIGIFGAFDARVTGVRPQPGASPDEWYAYVEQRLDELDSRDEVEERHRREADQRLSDELALERTERAADDEHLRAEFRAALGGEAGKGLDRVLRRLLFGFAGTLLASLAAIFD